MPIVPQYQPGVEQRPIFQQNLTSRASADDMGAAIGRGMQGLAQGVGQVATAMQQVQELEDVARAKEADNQFAAWLRERQYGENGFLTLQGRAAVDARAAFEADVAEARQRYGHGLTPGAQQSYATASTARLNSTLDQSIVHTANQRKQWFQDASTARIDTFAEDALAGYANPQTVMRNIAAGQAELRQQGEMLGWDADVLSNREAEFISGVHKNVALRMAQSDPLAADAYRRENNDSLTGPHQYELERALGSAVREAQAIREADAILQTTRTQAAPSGGPSASGMTGPTASRAFLLDRLVTQNRTEDVTGLDGNFAANLSAMIQDAPPGVAEGLGVLSGYRSVERQQVLWQDALRRYGSPEAARQWVAPPGNSQHNHGQAVDLAFNGRSLQHAPQHVLDWVHENAGKYGMYFPMAHEPWHIEPQGSRGGTVAPRTGDVAPRTVMPSYADIEAQLEGIADPVVRDLTRRRLYAHMETMNRAASQAETAARSELWSYVERGMTPDDVPQEVRLAAGLSSVQSAWSYIESTAARGAPSDDDNLVYDMRRYAAENPGQFALIDLNDYRERLSPTTFKEMTGLQTSALTDERRAREEGLSITTAFGQAQTALEAVGITTTGQDNAGKRAEAAARIAQFNNVLAQQMAEFKELNDGRNPSQMDIQQMINRLLLPVVIREPSWSVNPFSGFQGENVINDRFLFETGTREPTSTVSMGVPYTQIPTVARSAIAADLEAELGRRPSDDEIAERYNEFLLEQVSGNVR